MKTYVRLMNRRRLFSLFPLLPMSLFGFSLQSKAEVPGGDIEWVEMECDAVRVPCGRGTRMMRPRNPNLHWSAMPESLQKMMGYPTITDRFMDKKYAEGIPCATRFRVPQGTLAKCPACGTVQASPEPTEGTLI